MREILFKGKRVDNGEWVEGDLYRRTDRFGEHETIIFEDKGPDCFKKNFVDPETVCQYIGLEDKNGKKIFEGDIVRYDSNISSIKHVGVVKYGTFNCSCCYGVYGWEFEDEDIRNYESYIVEGNIFDNKDLLTED